jgi:vacuolar protein sorting-associated protein 13A/C
MVRHLCLKLENLVGRRYGQREEVWLLDLTYAIQVFSLEASAAETEMVVPSSRQKAEEYHIGLSWTEGLGKYKLTKVITLVPRFIIKNCLSDPICFREHGVASRGRTILNPGERCPLQIMQVSPEKLLTIAYPGLNSQW